MARTTNARRAQLDTSAIAYAATHTERVCCDCRTLKSLAAFSKNTSDKSGLHAYCKTCATARTAAWRDKNPEHRAAYEREYERSDRGRARRKRYYEAHQQELIAVAKAWNQANGKRRWQLKKNDLQQLLSDYLRSRLYRAVRAQLTDKKDKGRGASAVRDLGCTIAELMLHLEKLFQPGMSWDNYSDWHIDHRSPLAKFDLTDPTQCREACHFSNLQPLWAADNLKKGDRET